MNPRRRHARPAALLLAALLLQLAPTAPVNVASAQRRRSAPRKPAPTAPAAPAAAASSSEAQRQEVERPFDTSIGADSYVVYVEVRGIGQLARANEVRTALDAFRLIGGSTQEVTDAIDFLTANEEALATVRVFTAAMPTRAGIPDGVTALQFPTPEAARSFEPKLRAFLEGMGAALGQPGAQPPQRRGRGASRRAQQSKRTPLVVVKRAGSWIYGAPSAFTFNSLKGDGTNMLASNARLQSFRSRLATESVFVYYETALWRRAWQLQQEESLKKQEAAMGGAGTITTTNPSVSTINADPVLMPEANRPNTGGDPKGTPPPAVDPETGITVTEAPTAEESPTPEAEPTAEVALGEDAPAVAGEEVAGTEAERRKMMAAQPSAEERAARAMMTTLLNGIFGGSVREPEALAVGVGLEGDVLVARLLVSRDADAPNNIVPFFPNVVAGPSVVPDSFAVAPADSEVFVTASFDWTRIYESLIDTMNKPAPSFGSDAHGGDGGESREGQERAASMQPASAEKGVEAMEKLFGFRLREDLLPALGSEVALSTPADWFEGRRRFITPGAGETDAAGEKKAEAGPVALISLNNPDTVRKMMPLVLVALGLGPQQTAAAPPERRKGFDIHDLGGMSYAFVNNFLVVGETAPAVRHVVDSYASNQTLAASTRFRDAVAWQEHQRLALGYVSDTMMTRYIDATKKMADGSTDPVVLAALAQLDVPPVAASYAATDKGDALMHELRVPVALVKLFAASSVIGIKEAPILGMESFVNSSLRHITSAQENFKGNKGRYASLEELFEAKILDRDHALTEEYSIDVQASGDKFTITATPRNYGKTGRRSFFTDETGVVRGANHKGQPATAADPPIDQ